MNESESNLTPTTTSTSNPVSASAITTAPTSKPTPTSTTTPTSTLNLTDLDALVNALPANRLYPDAKPKPILATAVKAIKHADAVADHSTPADKTALDTAKNYTSAARTTYDAAIEAAQAAHDAADDTKNRHDLLKPEFDTARAASDASSRANEARAKANAELHGDTSYSYGPDKDLIQADNEARVRAQAALDAARTAIAAHEAAIINTFAAAIALVAAESAERIVAKVVGITPNDRYLNPGVVTNVLAVVAKVATDDRAYATRARNAARIKGGVFAAIIGALTHLVNVSKSDCFNPLIGVGLVLATSATTYVIIHSAAATEVHNAYYDARVSSAFADVTAKLVEKIGDLEAFYNKIKKV